MKSAESPAASVATEAEGLRLHLSGRSSSGYKHVYRQVHKFQAFLNGEHLGMYRTAVEAAVVVARRLQKGNGGERSQRKRLASGSGAPKKRARNGSEDITYADVVEGEDGDAFPWESDKDEAEEEADEVPDEQQEAVVEQAEGLRLHLSQKSSTGYKGVCRALGCTRESYQARGPAVAGQQPHLGYFRTAVKGAVAYARHVQQMEDDEDEDEDEDVAEVAEQEPSSGKRPNRPATDEPGAQRPCARPRQPQVHVEVVDVDEERGQDHARRKQRRLDETPGGGSWEEQLYVVEQILARRQGPEGGGREYLVSWHGYDSSWNTWEPAANIRAPKLIAAFERRQAALDAPPPSKRRPAALAAAGASSSGGSGGISLAKKEGKAMVGVRVRVWWEYDAKWFAGTVRRLPTRSPGNPLTVGRFAVLSSSPRGPSPPPSSP